MGKPREGQRKMVPSGTFAFLTFEILIKQLEMIERERDMRHSSIKTRLNSCLCYCEKVDLKGLTGS